jgi:hypothetical protein
MVAECAAETAPVVAIRTDARVRIAFFISFPRNQSNAERQQLSSCGRIRQDFAAKLGAKTVRKC